MSHKYFIFKDFVIIFLTFKILSTVSFYTVSLARLSPT